MPLNKKDLEKIKKVVNDSIDERVPKIIDERVPSLVEKVVEPYFMAIQNDFNRNFEEHQKFFEKLEKNSEEHKDMQLDLRNFGRRITAIENFLAEHGVLLREHSVMLNNIKEELQELKESGRIVKEQVLDLEKRVEELEVKI